MIFSNYANYYNLFYKDKAYDAEAKYVVDLILKFKPDAKTILDVGCGTGKHAYLMSQLGFQVEGIDQSEKMLEAAKANFPELKFYQGDGRNFKLDHKFDVVTSLFHVASYQKLNDDMNHYMSTINRHINTDGLFIFDFWYGPGVLEDKPIVRVKRLEDENIKVTRIAEPELHLNENLVDVNYEVIIEDKKSGQFERVIETHHVRYFFLPEIQLFMQSHGFEIIGRYEWMTEQMPQNRAWYVCVVGRKK